jgi:hypothetical protein
LRSLNHVVERSIAEVLRGARGQPLKQKIHLQKVAVLDAVEPMKLGRFAAAKAHGGQLREHLLGPGAAAIEVDERYFHENIVGLRQDGATADQNVQFRALGVDLDEVELAAGKDIVQPNGLDLDLEQHLVPEIGGVFTV